MPRGDALDPERVPQDAGDTSFISSVPGFCERVVIRKKPGRISVGAVTDSNLADSHGVPDVRRPGGLPSK